MIFGPYRFIATQVVAGALGVAGMTATSQSLTSHALSVGQVGGYPMTAIAMPASDNDEEEVPALTAIADFDGDGTPDMVEVRAPQRGASGRAELILLRGRRGGRYGERATFPLAGSDPQAIVVGDFSGDGIPDVIVGDGNGGLTEFLGNGRGGLEPAGEIAHVSSVVSIAAADFNHDGKLDLAISDSHTGTVSMLLGAGGGIFQSGWSFRLPMPGSVYRLAAADFNGDGIADLAVTNDDGDAYEVMLGNGNGTFTSSSELSHLKDPNAHCVT